MIQQICTTKKRQIAVFSFVSVWACVYVLKEIYNLGLVKEQFLSVTVNCTVFINDDSEHKSYINKCILYINIIFHFPQIP